MLESIKAGARDFVVKPFQAERCSRPSARPWPSRPGKPAGSDPLSPRGSRGLTPTGSEPEARDRSGEPVVEGENLGRACILSCKQDAAVREPEAAPGAQLRESAPSVLRQGNVGESDRRKRILGRIETFAARRPDEHLGARHRAAGEYLVGSAQERLDRALVLRIVGVEVRNQDAGIDDDQAGQSSRRPDR